MIANKKQYSIAMITIILTTVFWGVGFVISDILLANGLHAGFVNSVRFVTATLLIGVVFCKKIKFEKKMFCYSIIGGILLFLAFMLQLSALNYTTAANNGFFTASYLVFVPLMVWVIKKKRPSLITTIGIVVALVGFFILNFCGDFGDDVNAKPNIWLGNLMTVISAIFFGMQIVLTDWALTKKGIDAMSFTFFQVAIAAVCFVIYFFIFDFATTNWTAIDWKECVPPLIFLAVLGTAFAYPSQINAQRCLSPSTVSLIMSFEAIIGAVISVIVGLDALTWTLIVGGLLVTIAIFIVEYLPEALDARKRRKASIIDQDNPNNHQDNPEDK